MTKKSEYESKVKELVRRNERLSDGFEAQLSRVKELEARIAEQEYMIMQLRGNLRDTDCYRTAIDRLTKQNNILVGKVQLAEKLLEKALRCRS